MRDGSKALKNVLLEGVVVALVGGVVALAANQVSPHRVSLTRNYNLGSRHDAVGLAATNSTISGNPSPLDSVRLKLQEAGLQLADGNQVTQLFHSPGYQQDTVIFLDARPAEDYEAGHIPGAYEFDWFHYEKYLDVVLPLCFKAETIVVYCNGGDCELSIDAAKLLTNEAKIPKAKVFVYAGGMTEWSGNGQPMEAGARNSGKPATK